MSRRVDSLRMGIERYDSPLGCRLGSGRAFVVLRGITDLFVSMAVNKPYAGCSACVRVCPVGVDFSGYPVGAVHCQTKEVYAAGN